MMNDKLFRTLLKRYEAEIEDALYKIQCIEDHDPYAGSNHARDHPADALVWVHERLRIAQAEHRGGCRHCMLRLFLQRRAAHLF